MKLALSDDVTLGTALVLMLLAMPLISIGTWNDVAGLWWAGLGVLAVGAAIPPAARYLVTDDDSDDDSDDGDGPDTADDHDDETEEDPR